MKNSQDKRMALEVKSLKKYFPVTRGFFGKKIGLIKAVDNVNLYVKEGEALGLAGESGCGKTTLGRCILRAIEPTGGDIFLRTNNEEMVNIVKLNKKNLRAIRRYAQMIFQDPYSSLDPRMTVLNIIGEPLLVSNMAKGKKLVDKVKDLAKAVGLDIKHLKRYPHAFSGGQRQRIGIARALAPNPMFIVADEPVSALDVSVQAQTLNLLQDLQKEFHLAYLFISHDLGVIEHVSDRVAIMYVGRIVETAKTEELFFNPEHPYTEALLSALPKSDPTLKIERIILPGEIANPANPPPGCHFHPRCRYAQDICKEKEPGWEETTPEHFTSCHFTNELSLKGVAA